MFNPPTHIRARTEYNISTRTLIAQSRFGVEILQDSYLPKQASINAFYVIAFLRCRSQRNHDRIIDPHAICVQRYYFFMNYANKLLFFCLWQSKRRKGLSYGFANHSARSMI